MTVKEARLPSILEIPLPNLHDSVSGRLDASRIAAYLNIPLRQLAGALGKSYQAVHKTPAAASLQGDLRSIKRSLDILEQLIGDHSRILAWWNHPRTDLGERTPLETLLEGHPDAVTDMLEAALMGTPT